MPRQTSRAVRYSAVVTLVLAILLIAETIGFSLYTYADVSRQLEPKNLVDSAEETIRERYPDFREQLVAELEQQAPEIAREVNDQVLASGPELREWLERATARQLEYGLDEATDLSAEQFRVFLQDNRPQIEQAFERLEDAPEETHELVLEMEADFEQQIGADVQENARVVIDIHRRVNDKLQRINSSAPLEPKELLERRIVRILRALEQEKLDELGGLAK